LRRLFGDQIGKYMGMYVNDHGFTIQTDIVYQFPVNSVMPITRGYNKSLDPKRTLAGNRRKSPCFFLSASPCKVKCQ
jgi:hypothetical protein